MQIDALVFGLTITEVPGGHPGDGPRSGQGVRRELRLVDNGR
jgi:hypothetical protein